LPQRWPPLDSSEALSLAFRGMKAEQLKGHLDLLLLAALAKGPAHGYALAESLRHTSDGALDLAEGTLYPALHRLETSGALRSRWATVGGRKRRVYALTARGRKALARETEGWRRFSASIRSILEAPA
jgi:PadR family transcriptional regulator PadR